MKNKWIMNIGAFFLVGALLTGCGTTTPDENDNLNNEREGDVPLEQNERDTNQGNQNEEDRGGNMQENDNDLEEQLEDDQMNRNNSQ